MVLQANALLDLHTSARSATWQFTLLRDDKIIGMLDVDRETPPSLSVDTSRSIKRTLTNVQLLPSVLDEVNVITDRVRVSMKLHDDTVWNQGLFMFADVSDAVVTQGLDVSALSLVDHLLIVDQKITESVSYAPSTVITEIITSLLAELPISFVIIPSGAIISSVEAIAWPAGTSRLRIVNELALMIGYHDLYFDNDGIGQMGPAPSPELEPQANVIPYPYEDGRTYLGSTTKSTNILDLPNRFVVVNGGAGDTPIFGVYDIPASAPHSFVNRGYLVTEVSQQQGIETTLDAQVAAQALARSWRFPMETIEFSSAPDPRHDHFNVIDFEGNLFLELAWSMSLRDGIEMRHTIRRTYEI